MSVKNESAEIKTISLYEALGEKVGLRKIVTDSHSAIQIEQLLEEPECKVFIHKFSLLLMSFISQQEKYIWMQEERIESYKKSSIERRTF
jgi:hypothetical protein